MKKTKKKKLKNKKRPPRLGNNQYLMDTVFLKEKEAYGLIALYDFYWYTCNWQEDNEGKVGIKRCFAANEFAAKALGVGRDRIVRWRARLKKLGLIKTHYHRDEERGRIKVWYIEVVDWKPTGNLRWQ